MRTPRGGRTPWGSGGPQSGFVGQNLVLWVIALAQPAGRPSSLPRASVSDQHQLGQERHRPEGLNRPERNTSPPRACRRGRPRSDHPAEQPIAERLGFAPQAKVFASSVARDRNPVGCVGGKAKGEEVRGTFVVGIPSDRSLCIKQVLIERGAVGGFTPAGKPPLELLFRSGIRSYCLVCCA